jgi:death-on-curing protein
VTVYLTLAEALAIHRDLIDRYGGSHGVRDPGLLDAALFRPQTGYYADVIEEAAALWESLAQNHPFVDGNKRLAFAATYTFLAANDLQLTASPDSAFDFINGLHVAGTFRFAELEQWLRQNVRAAKKR